MTPLKPTVEPTEISISPIRIASSMPQQIIAFTALERSRFRIFDGVRNFGSEIATIATRIIRPTMIPMFLLK